MSPGSGTEFLACRGVVKRFGSTVALAGADLAARQGDVLALVGPSGCGKTTLLRVVAGFEQPDAGEVRLEGRVLNGRGISVPPDRRRVGMVFQDFALFPHMSVARNIAFGLPKGVDRRRRVQELLDLVGLPGLEARMPHELSGGQQQRVAMARALAAEPALMLLDEPFSNLDPSIRQRVRSEVKQLIRAIGITAVFVTHDQEEALSIAEQVAVMVAGRVRQVGAPHEVYSRPADRTVAAFIGEANLLPGKVSGGMSESELGRVPVSADFAGNAEMMVRAEDLAITEHGGTPVEVEHVEYYGHDMLVTARLGSGRPLRVRLKTGLELQPGQRVGVTVTGRMLAFPSP